MLLNKMVTDEHKRRAQEWHPKRTPVWYAMFEYFHNALGYNEQEAMTKTDQFFRG